MNDGAQINKLIELQIRLEKEKVQLDNQKVNKKEQHWILVCDNQKIRHQLKQLEDFNADFQSRNSEADEQLESIINKNKQQSNELVMLDEKITQKQKQLENKRSQVQKMRLSTKKQTEKVEHLQNIKIQNQQLMKQYSSFHHKLNSLNQINFLLKQKQKLANELLSTIKNTYYPLK